MDYLRRVRSGIDYIESNLDSDITPGQIAKYAGLSQWHFQRIFKALTNETLKTYIRSRRLANSLEKLLTSRLRIIDIAVSAGYESQESFSRAFKTAFDLTPSEYRKLGDKSLFLKKLKFDTDYLTHINRNISLEPDVHSQNAMHLVGLRTQFYGIDSEKNNVGEKLPILWAAFLERLNEVENTIAGACYGVVQQVRENSDLLEYYAAVEVQEPPRLPNRMEHVWIPCAEYAKFTHRGAVRHIDKTVNYIYSSWLLNSGKRHTAGPDLETYGQEYDPVSDNSLMYYSIPVD